MPDTVAHSKKRPTKEVNCSSLKTPFKPFTLTSIAVCHPLCCLTVLQHVFPPELSGSWQGRLTPGAAEWSLIQAVLHKKSPATQDAEHKSGAPERRVVVDLDLNEPPFTVLPSKASDSWRTAGRHRRFLKQLRRTRNLTRREAHPASCGILTSEHQGRRP